jgi:hypothetical protein
LNAYEISAVLCSFLAHLQSPLVPTEVTSNLNERIESYQCVRLANSLPNENRDTLMYLIGFLKRLVLCEAVTKMGARNYAICFAPVIFETGSIQDRNLAQRFVDMSAECLVNLIETWDTRELYPLTPVYLQTCQ